jgi:hypothetical protein
MPSTSKKQHNFMAAIANNPAFAKKVGIPQSVGKDFDEADKGKKFGSGGRTRPDVQKVNKSKTDHGKMTFFKEGGDTMASKMNPGFMAMMAKKKAGAKAADKAEMPMKKMKMGGMANGGSASKRADGVASKGKTKGTMIGMKMGGKAC